jgi:hypothetical protein
VRRGRLHLDGGEVNIRKRKLNFDLLNVKQLITCMNLCSGGATVGLVAEVTVLTGIQVHEVVQNARQKARSEKMTLKERHKRSSSKIKNGYDEF